MNGADAVLRSLEAEGVDVMFGLPGGAILPTYDAIARGTTVRHVLARHEQGAGHMAQGYARASGRVGVAIATSGPGRDEPRHADRRRVDGLDAARLRHRPGALEPDRHRRVPGVRHRRRDDADREALVARPGRRRDPDVMKAAFHLARTGPLRARCWSTFRATSRRRSSTSSYPDERRPARLAAAETRPPAPGRARPRGDRGGREARALRRRRRRSTPTPGRAARARRGRAACRS